MVNDALYMDELMQRASEQEWRDVKKSDQILKRLQRTVKPKIWQAINWDLHSHICLVIGIVTVDQVAGSKRTGHDYFGESTAVRHVYDDVSSCTYSDSYGGNVYLYLGKKRYLMMYVHG